MNLEKPADHIPEADLQSTVIELAHVNGWLVNHNYDSRRSGPDPGYPDLTLARRSPDGAAGQVLFLELKRARESPTATQLLWGERLPHWHVVRPDALDSWLPGCWKKDVLRWKRDEGKSDGRCNGLRFPSMQEHFPGQEPKHGLLPTELQVVYDPHGAGHFSQDGLPSVWQAEFDVG